MAIGIGFISIIGIFVPVVTNFLSHDDLKNRISKLEDKIDIVEPKIENINIQELDKAVYYIERNANAKMLFMAMGIKFYHIIQNKTLILT